MKTRQCHDIVVVGAGLTGLSAAVLLARSGHCVTVLDRDAATPPPAGDAWETWDRPGVSQFRQPHLMLPRWHHEMARELPELLDRLITDGASPANLLHLQQESATQGWAPGDEQFDTIAVRRPVLEASLAQLALTEPGVSVRRGVRATGLLVRSAGPVPDVCGVRTTVGEVAADLVVDAAGRRTPVPGWLTSWGAGPTEEREERGFVYYTRHFQSLDGRAPGGRGTVLTHHASLSVLTLPGDRGAFSIVLVTGSDDRALRSLRENGAWLAAARCSPVAARWLVAGEPTTDVRPLAGLGDLRRRYVVDDGPVVTGLAAVGDAYAATNPALGRGATTGLLQACALRDLLAEPWPDPREQALRFGALTAQRVAPWVDATVRFDRYRLAEMDAEIAGLPYRPDDPVWAMSTALMAGARSDPVLARASSRIGGLLAAPPDVLSDPAVQRRLAPFVGGPRYPAGDPSRAEILRAVTSAPVGAA